MNNSDIDPNVYDEKSPKISSSPAGEIYKSSDPKARVNVRPRLGKLAKRTALCDLTFVPWARALIKLSDLFDGGLAEPSSGLDGAKI